ncbi:MAG: hypothetical protein M3063_09810 [Actinomycetota bacterium]|nr:hypothetical protein [Actinomycetota bacterium]
MSDATSAKPVLKPDVPGTYALHLKTTENAPGREPVEAEDTVQASVMPNELPIGTPIETMLDGGIDLGGSFVRGGDWVQVAVINRTTRGIDHARARAFNSGDDPQLLKDAVNPHPNPNPDN